MEHPARPHPANAVSDAIHNTGWFRSKILMKTKEIPMITTNPGELLYVLRQIPMGPFAGLVSERKIDQESAIYPIALELVILALAIACKGWARKIFVTIFILIWLFTGFLSLGSLA